jgi:hypothetical protein
LYSSNGIKRPTESVPPRSSRPLLNIVTNIFAVKMLGLEGAVSVMLLRHRRGLSRPVGGEATAMG